MPRVTRVKKAQKKQGECGQCGVAIKKGDSYVWWKFRHGERHIRCTSTSCAPSRSDLTQSSFLKGLYSVQDEDPPDCDAESYRDDLVSRLEELRDDCQSSLDNMPQGLQEGDTGQLLQTRIENLEQGINDLASIDFDAYKTMLENLKREMSDALDSIDAG